MPFRHNESRICISTLCRILIKKKTTNTAAKTIGCALERVVSPESFIQFRASLKEGQRLHQLQEVNFTSAHTGCSPYHSGPECTLSCIGPKLYASVPGREHRRFLGKLIIPIIGSGKSRLVSVEPLRLLVAVDSGNYLDNAFDGPCLISCWNHDMAWFAIIESRECAPRHAPGFVGFTRLERFL